MLNNNGNVHSLQTPDEQVVVVSSYESLKKKRVLYQRNKKQLQDIFRTSLHKLMSSRSRGLHTKVGYDPSKVEDIYKRGLCAVYF